MTGLLNLALEKPAWQVGSLTADSVAGNAVDGDARNVPATSCAFGKTDDVS